MKTRNVLNTSLGKFFQFLSMSLLVVVVLLGISLHQAYAGSLAESPNAPTAFCDSVTEIPKSECEALVALYNSTGGANWTYKDNWLVTTTPGDWVGVEVSGGHVSHLFLGSNHLTGSIPPGLGNLTVLEGLDLGGNQLIGSIPPELGNLTALQILVLAGNQLSGSIPPELGNLTALTAISLSENQLTGSIPNGLGNMTALQYLALYSNQLTGSLPSELGNLTALLWLSLSKAIH
jgi:Leucine-rich repeat (LRR) protein